MSDGHCTDDTDRSLLPIAAHLQGIGVGLILGYIAVEAWGFTYPVAAVAFVLITVGYYFDKRSQRTDIARDGGADDE